MPKTLQPPPPPPSRDSLLELLRRVVPNEYYDALVDVGDGTPHPSFAIYRGIAQMFATLAAKGTRSVEARHYLPSAVQRDLPASSGRAASGNVRLRRVGPTDQALVIDAGRARLVTDGGREYVNASRVVWNPGDTDDRVVLFVCEVTGFVGNLDHLADDNGLLDLDLISIKDQDRGRSAPGGSLLGGAQIVLQDAGVPDVFDPDDVGLYVRINTSAAPVLEGQVRRIVGFDWPRLELPPGSGRFPRRVYLEELVRKNTVEALQDDGGVFTDYYAEASDEASGDVPLLPAAPVLNDAFYVGYSDPFAGAVIDLTTPGDGDWAITWEYWDGLAWQPLDASDGTDSFRLGAGEFTVSWTVPLDWQSQASPAGTGTSLFFARGRLSAFVSAATPPVGGRVVVLAPDGLDGFSAAGEALQDDGGVVTDYTAAAKDNALDDVPLLPAAPAVGDAFYVGAPDDFSEIRIDLTTPGLGNVYAIAWEYWDGLAWTAIPGVNDGTNGFINGGVQTVKFDPPPDWEVLLSPGGSGAFLKFVRARVTSFTSLAVQPLASRVRISTVIDNGTLGWTLLDFQADSLGLEIAECEAFAGGRDDDLWLLGDERGIYRQPLESDDTFRDRASRLADVVSPNAIARTLNRILAPIGRTGRAQDVQFNGVGGGFIGLFCDVEPQLAPDVVSALDLYGAGDVYPQNPWFVVQSAQEAYGWYIVSLPYLGEGDFGIFCDDGPTYFDSVAGVYYGPALGGWCDGYPVVGYATYAAIHAALDAIDAGGVGFTLVRSENLTIP